MTKFEPLQEVELADDFASEGIARGTRGAIVKKFDTPSEASDVEIVSDEGRPKFCSRRYDQTKFVWFDRGFFSCFA